METSFPRLFYRLRFEVLSEIDNLEYYQGIYWSAMLRAWSRPYFHAPLSELGIYPLPVHNAFGEYHPQEQIALDISLPAQYESRLLAMLNDELQQRPRAAFPEGRMHFYPGKSIKLLGFEVLQMTEKITTIDLGIIQLEASFLAEKYEHLDIIFHSPLRLKPNSEYRQSYSYLDPTAFNSESFFSAFCREMGLDICEYPPLEAKGMIWLDVPYEKTLCGLIGGIRIAMPQDKKLLEALVAGQYCGIGKNRSFGFGFYYLAESPGFRSKSPAPAYCSFLQRSARSDNLRNALENMKSGSPGPDNLAKEDLLDSGSSYLRNAAKVLLSGKMEPGDTLNFKKRSSGGNYRLIRVQNIHERHILLSILMQINVPLDRLLSPGCYSYRSGRDYHQAAQRVFNSFRKGFGLGIKADIRAFFDSIDRSGLYLLLKGLFNTDPVADFIQNYMLTPGLGIAQGNPLSPLLSNLWLIPFDREIKNKGWFLVRYADDFCIICDKGNGENPSLESLNKILETQKLSLAEEKCRVFKADDTIEFVGYKVSRELCEKIKAIKVEDYSLHGIPAFQEDYRKGKPLYLTFMDSYASFDNGNLIIKKNEENRIVGTPDTCCLTPG